MAPSATLASPFPPNLRAMLFDVDGTLYHAGRLRLEMLRRLAVACLRDPRSGVGAARAIRAYRRAQEELRVSGGPAGSLAEAQVELACARSGLPPDLVRRAVSEWMEEAPLGVLARYVRPGLRELLAGAARRGVACAVVSDYPAAAKLRALGIEGYFQVQVCAQDAGVGAFKPSPAGLLHALRALGVPPDEAVYVGDRPAVDAEAARRAGMGCVLVGGAPGAVPDYAALGRMLGWA